VEKLQRKKVFWFKIFSTTKEKVHEKKKNEKKNCEQADTIKYVYSEPGDSHAEYNEWNLNG
jgi:hypothetical protein